MKFNEATEPKCASAKVRQKRPDSSLLRVISKKETHPGYGYRIRRWDTYEVGMSVLHCWETAGLDHLDIGFYEEHGLMTLRPMTQEERQDALRPWDGNNPIRGGTVYEPIGGGERTLSATREANTTAHVPGMRPSLEYFASLVPSHLLGVLRGGVLLWPGCVLAPVARIPAGDQSGVRTEAWPQRAEAENGEKKHRVRETTTGTLLPVLRAVGGRPAPAYARGNAPSVQEHGSRSVHYTCEQLHLRENE